MRQVPLPNAVPAAAGFYANGFVEPPPCDAWGVSLELPGRKKKAKQSPIDRRSLVLRLKPGPDGKAGDGAVGGPEDRSGTANRRGRTRGGPPGRGKGALAAPGDGPDRSDPVEAALRALAADLGSVRVASSTSVPPMPAGAPDGMERLPVVNEREEQRRAWEPMPPGTKWKCMRCGRCCRESWRVNLTWEEYDRLCGDLDINGLVVDEATGMSHPVMVIEGACRALDRERNICTIYRRRTYSCATFPFSLAPDGTLMITRYCEGFGQGPEVSERKMVEHILRWRKRAGMSRKHLRRTPTRN